MFLYSNFEDNVRIALDRITGEMKELYDDYIVEIIILVKLKSVRNLLYLNSKNVSIIERSCQYSTDRIQTLANSIIKKNMRRQQINQLINNK